MNKEWKFYRNLNKDQRLRLIKTGWRLLTIEGDLEIYCRKKLNLVEKVL